MDVPRALKVATDTGNVRFGVREVKKALRARSAKLVVVASNCPAADLGAPGDVRVHRFEGTNVELGAACGVPFSVSALAVLGAGESNILSV
ncbi:MAG: 50S ribosomal protein L30e [Euryarchaeota archaeon RBG_16_68_13]|nr:MAG: 50S ribosomal protein L30e [Euryarchaeota archaeon RBG_16_68_13]